MAPASEMTSRKSNNKAFFDSALTDSEETQKVTEDAKSKRWWCPDKYEQHEQDTKDALLAGPQQTRAGTWRGRNKEGDSSQTSFWPQIQVNTTNKYQDLETPHDAEGPDSPPPVWRQPRSQNQSFNSKDPKKFGGQRLKDRATKTFQNLH